ncbi:hypothetical protein HJC10_00120 [Corallococcus exiguus]|nr:hypothetical protein [Corallococcus exiguus]NNB92452.1 hypothetical protein [Corallococcus exiguus]NNC01270.1 hypothetical protein [Corallococcus exiguus]
MTLERGNDSPHADQSHVYMVYEQPVQVAEAAWCWVLKLLIGRADEELA